MEVVVISADEFRRLEGERTGAALIAAPHSVPCRDLDVDPRRGAAPVRDLTL